MDFLTIVTDSFFNMALYSKNIFSKTNSSFFIQVFNFMEINVLFDQSHDLICTFSAFINVS